VSFSFLLLGFFHGDHFQTATSTPSLRPAHPEQFPNNFPESQVITIIQSLLLYSLSLPTQSSQVSLSLSLSLTTVGDVTHGAAGAPTLSGSSCICSFFSHFGAGRPLHKVQSIFCIITVDLAVHLATSCLLVFLNILLFVARSLC
jgi:hypothetical protein